MEGDEDNARLLETPKSPYSMHWQPSIEPPSSEFDIRPVKFEASAPEPSHPPLQTTKRVWADYIGDGEIDSDPDDFSEFLLADDVALWREFKPHVALKLCESEEEFDVKQDELPASVFWSAEAMDVKTRIRDFVDSFIKILTLPEFDIDGISKLKTFVSALNKPTYPAPRKLGFRGNSGVGKSSLINSLLGQKDLVESGDMGGAMTSVCTQIKQREQDYPNKFRAIVRFKGHKELRDMFEDWIHDYHTMRQTSEDLTAGKDDSIPDHILQRGNAAVDNLTTMFCFRAELESTSATMQWLDESLGIAENPPNSTDTLSEARCQKIIGALVDLSQHLLTENRVAGAALEIDADDTSSLHTDLSIFTRSLPESMDEDQPKGSPWPLVKRVTIYTNSQLLQRNLVLCDLPGMLDINTTRTSLTRRELQTCSDIAVVADVKRVLTDENVENDLKASFKAKGGRVILVVTGIDKVNTNRGQIQNSLRDAKASQELCDRSERLKALAECIENLRSKAKARDASKRLKSFKTRLSQWLAMINVLQKEILVTARNEYISSNMNKQFKRNTGSIEPLSIYFVSNFDYYRICSSSFDEQFPISFGLTGIAQLRAALAKPFDEGIKETLQYHVTEKLTRMVDALDIYASEDQHVQIGKVRNLIEPQTEFWAKAMTGLTQDLDASLGDLVIIPLQRSQKEWKQAAATQIKIWIKTLSWQKFNSMIRSEGDGPRKSRAFARGLNWNKAFSDITVADCQNALDQMRERVKELFVEYREKIEGEAANMESLSGYPSEIDEGSKSIRQQVRETVKRMLSILEDFQTEYWADFNHMEAALTAFDSENIIYEATRPMFTAIIQAHPGGKGSVSRRRDELQVAVEKGEPFRSIISLVETNFRNETRALGTEYQEEGHQAIGEMIDRLGNAMSHHQNKDPKAVSFRAALRKEIEEARKRHMDELIPAVNRLMETVVKIKQEIV